MPTRLVTPNAPEPSIIAEAAAHLRAGRLVAFPTETVYGLGANAMDPAAVARIYEAKGRPAYNPLIVHLASAADVHAVAADWPPAAARLADAFWPGPLTIVVQRHPDVPDAVTAGLGFVAVRVPSHPVARALIAAARVPVAAPSANRSTELSPTRASHVERSLGDRVAMILDGGPTTVGIESTVVDVSGGRPVLLRPGTVTRAALESVIGPVDLPGAQPGAGEARSSPGQMERHYAPRARVLLFDAADAADVAAALGAARQSGARTGMLTWQGAESLAADVADERIALPSDPAAYARGLYAALHELDDRGCSVVAVARPPAGDEWTGVRDRLARATTG